MRLNGSFPLVYHIEDETDISVTEINVHYQFLKDEFIHTLVKHKYISLVVIVIVNCIVGCFFL